MEALKRLIRFTPAAALAMAIALPALAQPGAPPREGRGPGGPGGRGGPGGGGMGMLLRSAEVRAELEILADQEDQLKELEQEIRSRARELFGGRGGRGGRGGEAAEGGRGRAGRGAAGGGRGGRPDRAQMQELQAEVEERLAEILTTQQMERLRQINAQVQLNRGGGRALMQGPLAEQLGITEEQRAELQAKAEEIRGQMQQRLQEVREEARELMLEVLTSEQRAQLDALTGEPFELSELVRGRGRGGRPGGPRGGRGPEAEPEL